MTHTETFAQGDYWRLVATFPLNGRDTDAYTVWHHTAQADPEHTEVYAICDNHGFNFAMSYTFGAALNYCTRNCGWGELTTLTEGVR